jgi:hypothetical protein
MGEDAMSVNHFPVQIPVFCDKCAEKVGEIEVPLHGGWYHSTYIMLAKYILWKRGIKMKNPDTFTKMANNPGIPDVYIEYSYKGKDDAGRTKTIVKSCCIEIETNATPESTASKNLQFTRPGMREPIIIDMGTSFEKWRDKERAKGNEFDDIMMAYNYIDYCLTL